MRRIFDPDDKRQRLMATRSLGNHLYIKIYHDQLTKILWFVINLNMPNKPVRELYRAHIGDRGNPLGLDDNEAFQITPRLMDMIELQVTLNEIDLMEDAAKSDKDFRFNERDYID